MSIVYTPLAMRFRGVPVLTNTPPTGAQEGAGAEPTGLRCRTEFSTRRPASWVSIS